MRSVCMVVEDYPPNGGGGGLFVQELAKRLSDEYRVHVFTSAVRNPPGDHHDGRVMITRLGKSRASFFAKTTARLSAGRAFDIYHAHGAFCGLVARVASGVKRKPAILHMHGYRDVASVGKMKHALQNSIVMLGYDRIVSVDGPGAEAIRKLGAPKERISVVPAGVDTGYFSPGRRRKRDGTILFVGRFERVKGLPTVLEAARILQGRGSEAVFRLVGRGSEEKDLKELAKEHGLKNVRFCAPVEHERIIGYYAEADAVLLASLSEGSPMVVAEAMACGVPAVLSDIAPLEAIARNSGAALTFKSRSPEALADRITELIGMPEKKYGWMRKRAREYAVSNHSWENVVRKMKKEYRGVLDARKAR